MGGRDHSCDVCGRGGFNDPEGECTCGLDPRPPLWSFRVGQRVEGWIVTEVDYVAEPESVTIKLEGVRA